MNAGEFAVIDNGGFVSTGLKNQGKAMAEIKVLKKDKNFKSKGKLTVVKIVGCFDNYMADNPEHRGADGIPIED